MDGQEYLNQISASVRPEKPPRKGLLGSPIVKYILIGVVAFTVIAIVGSMIGGGNENKNNKSLALKLHIDNTLGVISSYQPRVKSSVLRSDSAVLYSVLSNTSRDMSEFVKNNKKKYKDLIKKEDAMAEELKADLFEAKINGILDKVYANKMAYEISLIMQRESVLYKNTSNEQLKEVLYTSSNSLENLYNKFNDFSTKY